MTESLPLPPLEFRELVGLTDEDAFDNPSGDSIHPQLDDAKYESVFDFGCGCGRTARLLMQQRARPRRYVGVDLHAGMVDWCQRNLAPRAEGFEFVHHDVFNPGLNPGVLKPRAARFPVGDEQFTLLEAISVFTHLVQAQAEHYLRETARILRPDGVAVTTWFLFDKRHYPMMQDFQNALYINEIDPTNAVIFDRDWLREAAASAGLAITAIGPPQIRGFHWSIFFERRRPGIHEAHFPDDQAPFGVRPPPHAGADSGGERAPATAVAGGGKRDGEDTGALPEPDRVAVYADLGPDSALRAPLKEAGTLERAYLAKARRLGAERLRFAELVDALSEENRALAAAGGDAAYRGNIAEALHAKETELAAAYAELARLERALEALRNRRALRYAARAQRLFSGLRRRT
jgi:SAM-dependent methyltransferase